MGKQKTAVMEEEPKDFLDDLLTPEEPILEEQTPLEEGEEQEKEEVKTPLEEGEEEEQDKLSKEEEEKQKEEITAEDLERELSQDEINELTPEQKGIFYGIQKERKKRQAAEQKAAYYQTQLQYGNKQTIVGNEQQEKQEPIFSNEDEEYLTKRDFLAFQQKQTELSQQRELQRHNQQIQETARLEMLETQARAKYTDYDERYQLALEVVRTNPAMKATLDNMFFHNEANPAEFMYEIAKLSPSFGRKKVEEKEKGNTFTKIVRNAEKAKTTVGITNSGGKASADYDSMSNEELGNYLSRLSEDSYYRVPLKYRKKALKI